VNKFPIIYVKIEGSISSSQLTPLTLAWATPIQSIIYFGKIHFITPFMYKSRISFILFSVSCLCLIYENNLDSFIAATFNKNWYSFLTSASIYRLIYKGKQCGINLYLRFRIEMFDILVDFEQICQKTSITVYLNHFHKRLQRSIRAHICGMITLATFNKHSSNLV
jgi:hypothetical protein